MNNSYYQVKKSKTKIFTNSTENTPQKTQTTTDMWEYDKGKTPDKLKIATWNANGIRSLMNQRKLIPYIEKSCIDILCINETKINY